MALDNANFIAELSITDPPGSDPLSQGDDQIRTIKRATFQSFPLIAAAVNLTDVQMNLAAIKNEENVFTANQTIRERLFLQRTADTGFTQFSFRDAAGVSLWDCYLDTLANGNDFNIDRNVGGILQDTPFSISNATGVVDFAHVPTVQGAPLWVAGEVRMFLFQTTPGTNWFVADGTFGTVNMSDRVMIAEGTTAAPAELNAQFIGTANAGVTGSTAITEAQMPAHVHQHGMTQTDQLSADTTNIEDQSAGTVADDPTRPFHVITEPTGGGAGHTHVSPEQNVSAGGAGRDFVRSLSRVVQYHQYVP